MLVVVGVFYRVLFAEMVSYTVGIVVRLLAIAQAGVLALHLVRLPHLRQVLVLLSQVFQLCFDVHILRFERLRLAHQVVDALALLEATLGRGNFISLAPSLSAILVFGR